MGLPSLRADYIQAEAFRCCLEHSGGKDSLGDLASGTLSMAGLHVHCVEDQESRVCWITQHGRPDRQTDRALSSEDGGTWATENEGTQQ